MKMPIFILLAAMLLNISTAHAQLSTGGNFVLSQSVIAGGGGSESSGGSFKVDGTAGQAVAGPSSNASTLRFQNGFWLEQDAVIAPPTITVSGKVTTPTGQGLRNVIVTLINTLGDRRTATSSSFGIYTFDNVASGDNYIITVTSKRYRFAPKILGINATLTNLDFVGLQ